MSLQRLKEPEDYGEDLDTNSNSEKMQLRYVT